MGFVFGVFRCYDFYGCSRPDDIVAFVVNYRRCDAGVFGELEDQAESCAVVVAKSEEGEEDVVALVDV